MFERITQYDPASDAYLDFTLFAWDPLLDASEPADDGLFWPVIDRLGWGVASTDINALSRRLSSEVNLLAAASIRLRAEDVAADLEHLIYLDDVPDLSEDSQEDFLFHLVGLGRRFVLDLDVDPSKAIRIAQADNYVESFKYVLDGCRNFYSAADFVDAYLARKRFARTVAPPSLNTMRKVRADLPGVVIRVFGEEYEAATPLGVERFQYFSRPNKDASAG